MARSAHAYVRGSTEKFYQWLRAASSQCIPRGPPTWICGDCHLGNLGPVADCDGKIDVQMRDFDQAVVGNPAHDLVRLALSLASAARGSDLPGVTTARVLEEMMHGYEEALLGRAAQSRGSKRQPEPVKLVMRRAISRTWKHLAKERLENTKPTIPLGKCFWPLSKREAVAIRRLFERTGMLSGQFLGRSIVMRELLPQDLKLEFDRLSREDAITGAHFLAATIGQAHSRQMDPKLRRAWRDTLRRNRSKRLNAPSWLWSSVVDLLVSHEGAYLEHCRRYSMHAQPPDSKQ